MGRFFHLDFLLTSLLLSFHREISGNLFMYELGLARCDVMARSLLAPGGSAHEWRARLTASADASDCILAGGSTLASIRLSSSPPTLTTHTPEHMFKKLLNRSSSSSSHSRSPSSASSNHVNSFSKSNSKTGVNALFSPPSYDEAAAATPSSSRQSGSASVARPATVLMEGGEDPFDVSGNEARA